MSDLRAREMRVFLQVVRGGSFSAAGRATGLTPSCATKLITRLEARLSVRGGTLHRRLAAAKRRPAGGLGSSRHAARQQWEKCHMAVLAQAGDAAS
jgi:hypothetical protein